MAVGIVLFLSLALLNFESATSLLCYRCSASLNVLTDCLTLNNIQATTCTEGQVCTKYVIEKPHTQILYRECAPRNICQTLEVGYADAPPVSVKECKICEEDNCNGGVVAISQNINGANPAKMASMFVLLPLVALLFV